MYCILFIIVFLQNFVLFGVSEEVGRRPLHIALATTTIFVPEANTTNYDAMQLQGPGSDLGFEYLRRTYNATFNFSHVYLIDKTRPTVAFLIEDVENFVAKFYYENLGRADGMAYLSSCNILRNIWL